METPRIIQLTINIHIDSEGNVGLTNSTVAQSIAEGIYPKRIFCPDCGANLRYADSLAQQIRKIAAHRRYCPGTESAQRLREKHENIFYPDLPDSE